MDVFSSSNSSFSIVNHRLMGGGVIHLECPKNRQGLGVPDMIILHYTAGTSAESSAKFLVRPDVKASAHVVIGRDGQVIQLFCRRRHHGSHRSCCIYHRMDLCSLHIYYRSRTFRIGTSEHTRQRKEQNIETPACSADIRCTGTYPDRSLHVYHTRQ